MAYNPSAALLLLAITAIATAVSGQSIDGIPLNVNGVSLAGGVCCTVEGNCPGGRGIAGANVSLNCYIGSALNAIGVATTNATGGFNITIATLPYNITNYNIMDNCYVKVPLPSPGAAASCPYLDVSGRLVAGLAPGKFIATRDYGVIATLKLLRYRKYQP